MDKGRLVAIPGARQPGRGGARAGHPAHAAAAHPREGPPRTAVAPTGPRGEGGAARQSVSGGPMRRRTPALRPPPLSRSRPRRSPRRSSARAPRRPGRPSDRSEPPSSSGGVGTRRRGHVGGPRRLAGRPRGAARRRQRRRRRGRDRGRARRHRAVQRRRSAEAATSSTTTPRPAGCARSTAARRRRPRMPREAFIDPETGQPYPFTPELVTSGVSVGVPGTPADLDEALRRWGSRGRCARCWPRGRARPRGFVVDEHVQPADHREPRALPRRSPRPSSSSSRRRCRRSARASATPTSPPPTACSAAQGPRLLLPRGSPARSSTPSAGPPLSGETDLRCRRGA